MDLTDVFHEVGSEGTQHLPSFGKCAWLQRIANGTLPGTMPCWILFVAVALGRSNPVGFFFQCTYKEIGVSKTEAHRQSQNDLTRWWNQLQSSSPTGSTCKDAGCCSSPHHSAHQQLACCPCPHPCPHHGGPEGRV